MRGLMPDRSAAMSLFYAVLFCFALSGVRGWNDRGLFPTKDDPMGEKDLFQSLTERQKQRWASPHESGSEGKLSKLDKLEVSTTIDIHLVGFSGEGNSGVNVVESDVRKYVDALKKEPWGHVLTNKPHHLNVKHKFLVNVVISPSQLHNDLFNAIRKTMPEEDSTRKPESELASISHRVVERILDKENEHTSEVYSVYVLNLNSQHKSYAYSYADGTSHPCLGTSYASKGRYFWVDLTAGPVVYGPSFSWEGQVGPRTFPVLSTYTGDQHHKAFLADLVAMVWNGVQHLVSPPLDHTPREFAPDTTIHLVHIGDGTFTPIDKEWEAIKEELLRGQEGDKILIANQVVRFQSSKLSLRKCAICTAALARATKTYMTGTKTTKYLMGHDYLDSKELHSLISSFYPTIQEEASLGGPTDLSLSDSGLRVIPVFVFDMEHSMVPLFLDRTDQAVAFDDMVVAVRNKGLPMSPATFMCNTETPPPAQNLTRSLMASILQTVWNVAPTHLRWSDARNRSVEDYRWSVGQTPFGPLSLITSLSFAQRDAALRNTLMAELNRTLGDARAVLRAVQEFGGEEVVMAAPRLKMYNARFNYLVQKLDKGLQALAAFHWDTAFFFLRSARHDVQGMRTIAEEAAFDLHTSLSCFTEPPTSSWWYIGLPFAGMLCYVIVGKTSVFKSKSKRF